MGSRKKFQTFKIIDSPYCSPLQELVKNGCKPAIFLVAVIEKMSVARTLTTALVAEGADYIP